MNIYVVLVAHSPLTVVSDEESRAKMLIDGLCASRNYPTCPNLLDLQISFFQMTGPFRMIALRRGDGGE